MAMNFPNLIEHLHELYYTRYRVQVFCSNTLPVTWWGVVCVDTVIGDKCYPCMWTCLCSLAIAKIICGILHALELLHELPQHVWLMLGTNRVCFISPYIFFCMVILFYCLLFMKSFPKIYWNYSLTQLNTL